MENSIVRFGLQYDPFEFLDAGSDPHLKNYFVVPTAASVVWEKDAPALVFALPGGGKSALRVYTEGVYRDSRGTKFPVRYIPENYDTSPDFHLNGLRGAFARAILVYLLSYPDIFNALPAPTRQQLVKTLRYLPFQIEFILSLLKSGETISDVEDILGVDALSGLSEFGEAHQVMANLIQENIPINQGEAALSIEQISSLIKDSLGAKTIHVLIDGLDGFSETIASAALLAWIQPLLECIHTWQQEDIYLKFFLPMDISDTSPVKTGALLERVRLAWDNERLAELIRRRVKAASNESYDSLDAVSVPELRDVEMQIARQLPVDKKLPRQMVIRARQVLFSAAKNLDHLIHSEDIFQAEGAS